LTAPAQFYELAVSIAKGIDATAEHSNDFHHAHAKQVA
jgi:hypothetical protein